MSEYSNGSEAVGSKGLIIAVVLIGLFILGLAFMGGDDGPQNPATGEGAAQVAPAADGSEVGAETGVATEAQ